MNVVLQNLLKLQAIEFGEVPGKSAEAEATELRGLIPQPFLAHYDRLRARSKKGVAIVRNDVCTGCHMKQPRGKVATIIRGEDIQLCDSCGRYLVVLEEAETQSPPAPEAPKPAPKSRKRKALVPA
ncbi:MAG: hypothetical protein C5B50_07365 [Verrucomicrobia bacterium]|nr:MAG: hypothetical protein C5B50_07365 [Verrucomicrobiota bacterium]